jgi:hypothetical protein
MSYRKNNNTLTYFLFACGFLPLFIWSLHDDGSWPRYFMMAYVMTAGLFGILMNGEYPPFASRWFWKAMLPIFVLHGAILFALFKISVVSSSIVPIALPMRAVYGFVGVLIIFEWHVCLRIIAWFRSNLDDLDVS